MSLTLSRTRRDQTSFGSLDYLLMALGNCFAVFSAGMAVGAEESGRVFVALIILGTCVSLVARKLFEDSRVIGLDSVLYTIATISAVVFSGQLNGFLPADGIPSDVTTAGWLCWMLSFGSFLTWRDRTLLFQAVPTIALFGLIGCYDTYAPAPFLFFGFLLCLATLLGRSHSRDMLRQAVLSGYFNRADSPLTLTAHPEQSAALYEDIKRGPWRWLAGPEWALASGLVIVILSLVGAPVIRHAVEPISGAIKVFAPRRMRNTIIPNRVATAESAYVVGRGPLPNPNAPARPQFLAKLDQMRYLRTSVFDLYTGHGWSSSMPSQMRPEDVGIGPVAISQMKQRNPFRIKIHRLTPSDTLPLPAEVENIHPSSVELNSAGSGIALDPQVEDFEIDGLESKTSPTNPSRQLPDAILKNCLERAGIDPKVDEFAKSAAVGAKNDFDRATAIRDAIAHRCKYFKGASAIPPDQDATAYFLNVSQVGYCDLFATAMVECARVIGIPSHFCIGYLPEAQFTDKRGDTVIYDQDYHAWAELYFQGVGWVVFDPTLGSEDIDPAKKSSGTSALARIAVIVLDILIVFGAIAVGWIYLRPRLGRARAATPNSERAEVRRVYLSFANAIYRATRLRRGIGETAMEYIGRVSASSSKESAITEPWQTAIELNLELETGLYGPVAPDADAVKQLQARVKSLKAMLSKTKRPLSKGKPID